MKMANYFVAWDDPPISSMGRMLPVTGGALYELQEKEALSRQQDSKKQKRPV